MTPDEADQALMLFAAQWPGKISDPTLILWRERLREHDAVDVRAAVDRLAETCNYWPSWSRVVEAIKAGTRGRAPTYTLPEPTGPPATETEVRAALAEARASLRSAGR